MELSERFTQSILTMYNDWISNGISLIYLGEFSHEITKMFTSMAESEMSRNSEESSTKRMVYHSMVETLQNMNRHSDELNDKSHVGKGLFMIGKKNDVYYIITSNKIAGDKVESLRSAIDQLNASTLEELKAMYKKQLKEGKLSEKGGAGLGLIDIARKTERKLEYALMPLFEQSDYFFILKVEIDTKKVKNEVCQS